MGHTMALVTGAMLAALSTVSCRGPKNAPSAASVVRDSVTALAKIKNLRERDMRAVLAGDTTTLMSLWTDDIVAIAPGRPITRGRARNAEVLRRDVAENGSVVPLEYVLELESVEVIGDVAIEWGTYRGRARTNATEVTYAGKVMRVLRRERDGEWRVARTMFTQEPPDSVTDNFVHPTGTTTAALGQLGHVERRGRGAVALILVPGAGFAWHTWEAFMQRNVEGFTMYAITAAGLDGSAPWPLPTKARADGTPDYSHREWSDAFVDAVAELVQKERLVGPVIVGHHVVGDYLALRLALDARVKARGLIIVGGSPPAAALPPNADPRRPGARDSVARDVFVHENQAPFMRRITSEGWSRGARPADALSIRPGVGERLKREQLAVPLPTQIRYYLEYLNADLSNQYAALQIPVLLVRIPVPYDRASAQLRQSLVEQAGSDSAARRLYATIVQGPPVRHPANTTITQIEDTGLFVMLDRPVEFDASVRRFVASLQ